MKRATQQGASLLIVLVLLTILLLGALSMSRVNEASTLIAGNVAFQDSAIQASEVGISEAFTLVSNLADEELDQGGWYFATHRDDDSYGMPKGIDWSQTPVVKVGAFDVRYIVDRQCTGAVPIQDINAQCVLKRISTTSSAKAGLEKLETAASKQYRITVYVTGPKNTKLYVQSMVVR